MCHTSCEQSDWIQLHLSMCRHFGITSKLLKVSEKTPEKREEIRLTSAKPCDIITMSGRVLHRQTFWEFIK